MAKKKRKPDKASIAKRDYDGLLAEVVSLLERACHTSARAVNAVMTATYWQIGRRIVEVEQAGKKRATYGTQLVSRLSQDLTSRFGRGYSQRNLEQMRQFYLSWPNPQTVSAQFEPGGRVADRSLPPAESDSQRTQTLSAKSQSVSPSNPAGIQAIGAAFPLPWSHYVRLLSVEDADARRFYEQESLRGGWSVRQLKRQIDSQFYERTLLSKNKAAMLREAAKPQPGEVTAAEEEIKDPFVLEFLDLKDEYSETDLEQALIDKLEEFLLELGGDFAFVGRQKRLRIGDEWYRIDLLFFHRKLRCLVVIDLKIGKFTHADAGQMHLYLNYAREHWTHDGENPPVGLILCARKDEAVAHYALEGLPNKVLAGQYRLALPDEATLVAELRRTQQALEFRGSREPAKPSTQKKQARASKKKTAKTTRKKTTKSRKKR